MFFKLFTISALLYLLYRITVKPSLEEGKKDPPDDEQTEDIDFEEID